MKGTAIHFSGGKDSLALLHMFQQERDGIRVYFADTGAVYPHVSAFVASTCERLGYELVVVAPPIPLAEWHARAGLPSDIVPGEMTVDLAPFLTEKPATRLQSYASCCGAMVWRPMYERMLADRIQLVIRGSKRTDKLFFAPDGYVDDNGIRYMMPLQDWSDEAVFAFLKARGAGLAKHYDEINASLDCSLCTAFQGHTGAAAKLRWTREHYPELWPELARRLRLVQGVVDDERAGIRAAFAVLEEAPC